MSGSNTSIASVAVAFFTTIDAFSYVQLLLIFGVFADISKAPSALALEPILLFFPSFIYGTAPVPYPVRVFLVPSANVITEVIYS